MQPLLSLHAFLDQHMLSMGQFIAGIVIISVLFLMLFLVVSLMAVKICQVKNVRFRSALMVSISYFVITIILNFVFRLITVHTYYSGEWINLMLSFVILSGLYIHFFKVSPLRGLSITFLVALIFLALIFLFNILLIS